jgi:hypothetical protein
MRCITLLPLCNDWQPVCTTIYVNQANGKSEDILRSLEIGIASIDLMLQWVVFIGKSSVENSQGASL